MKQKFYLLVLLAKLFTVANLLRYLEIEIQYFQICEGETLQGREPSSRNQFRDWKDWENLLVYSDLQTVQCILILCIISPASRLYLYHESSHHNQDLSAAMLEGQTFNIDTALEIWPTHIHSTAESSIKHFQASPHKCRSVDRSWAYLETNDKLPWKGSSSLQSLSLCHVSGAPNLDIQRRFCWKAWSQSIKFWLTLTFNEIMNYE